MLWVWPPKDQKIKNKLKMAQRFKYKTWCHKILDENISKSFSDINHTNVLLGQSLKAIEIKPKINQWDLIKLTSFYTAKESIHTHKRQFILWEKTVANNTTNKGLISNIYKLIEEKKKKKNQKPKTNNPVEKWAKTWSSHRGTAETNLARNHEVTSLNPGLHQWIKDPALLWAVV